MIVILFGRPGSGKGTQAELVVDRIGIPHVSTGDMLREQAEAGSALGTEAAPYMDAGGLAPDDLLVRLVADRLERPDASNGLLLDGFPRTTPQARALDEMLSTRGMEVGCVLVLDVPKDVLVGRLLKRGDTQGRADDTLDTIHHRMDTFERDTAPVLAYYVAQGTRVEHVDGRGAIEDVARRISVALGRPNGGDGHARVARA